LDLSIMLLLFLVLILMRVVEPARLI
jgi:hypothetical protein